jgi:hypothetical protein
MEETKVFRFAAALPLFKTRFQEAKGSHHVGLHKDFRAKNGAVHVCAMDESMSCCRVWGKILKIGKIASVGQSIQVDNAPVGSFGKNMADEICAYKTGTTGHQKVSCTHT